ncbi:MAG: hypothetical protein ACI845_002892 [Gammaproteobacteria bacterium]|jgi:hypothetical protein
MTIRIAMWSGPRNISTAMMRAWENRSDCQVWDEPLYGYYLNKTGIEHPGAAEVILDQGTDWRAITKRCAHDTFGGKKISYQKHMTLHLLDEINRDWLQSMTSCFLIRDPESVIASYAAVREQPTLEDIGFVQQAELFDYVSQQSGAIPLVIDSADFLKNPSDMLPLFCEKLGVEFNADMLSWPAGPRDTDGVWAKYWYDSVCQSTGFSKPKHRELNLSQHEREISKLAHPYYEKLYQHRLQVI